MCDKQFYLLNFSVFHLYNIAKINALWLCNKMAQVSLRNSPAMQLEDVPFKAIQGHLSRSQSKARIGVPISR